MEMRRDNGVDWNFVQNVYLRPPIVSSKAEGPGVVQAGEKKALKKPPAALNT